MSSLRLCFFYTTGRPLSHHSFTVRLNHQTVQIHLNDEGCSTLLMLNETDWHGTLVLDHCEMIDLKTGYPTHKQIIPLYDFKDKEPELRITVLPPPILINLGNQHSLTLEQLKYFKENGNNVLLFIHGYHIALGEYGCYPEAYEIQKSMMITEPHLKTKDESISHSYIEFKKSHYTRTICCDLTQKEELGSLFPELSLCYKNYFSRYHPENNPEGFGKENAIFNGTEARQWFVQMEYNFNRAAGFSHPNYQTYSRIVGIHWPGNVKSVDFKEAEQRADASAEALFYLILQLIEENLRIHIIAHSLGCRVALQMMNRLLPLSKGPLINHLILWQAALPHTVFSQGSAFEPAIQHAEKIIVLHSRKDRILQTLYNASHLRTFTEHKALGYTGVNRDPLTSLLQKSGKLIIVDQSKHLFGHSFMKIPTLRLMREIYQEYIIGGSHGIQHFGRYGPS